MRAVLKTDISGFSCKRGKVRDIYDLGDTLLIVATDRISAFDCVMPNGIPDKGKVLTAMSLFWFDFLKGTTANHLVSTDVAALGAPFAKAARELEGRTMVCRKAEVLPVECVVRGYLAGSGWAEYSRAGTVAGRKLPEGLVESSKLPEPLFTPATKAETGHDENISFERAAEIIGAPLATEVRRRSIEIYERACAYAAGRGILIADTKFEWGMADSELILVDEALTPDSSRFWPAESYRPGTAQPSFDKQYVRDWLISTGWDKNPPAPELPAQVVAKTREKYLEAYERVVGRRFKA